MNPSKTIIQPKRLLLIPPIKIAKRPSTTEKMNASIFFSPFLDTKERMKLARRLYSNFLKNQRREIIAFASFSES